MAIVRASHFSQLFSAIYCGVRHTKRGKSYHGTKLLDNNVLTYMSSNRCSILKKREIFNLPGGVQGFLLFNIILIPIVLLGYKSVIVNDPTARKYSYFCAGLGIITFVNHLAFMILDYAQFTLPLSMIIIMSCLISSLYQIKQTLKYGKVSSHA